MIMAYNQRKLKILFHKIVFWKKILVLLKSSKKKKKKEPLIQKCYVLIMLCLKLLSSQWTVIDNLHKEDKPHKNHCKSCAQVY